MPGRRKAAGAPDRLTPRCVECPFPNPLQGVGGRAHDPTDTLATIDSSHFFDGVKHVPAHSTRAGSLFVPLVAGGLLFLTGCPGDTPPVGKSGTSPKSQAKSGDADDHDHGHHHHHHAEKGLHGGVARGDSVATIFIHFEVVPRWRDRNRHGLRARRLAAEKPVAITQKHLQLALTLEHDHHKHGDDKKEDAENKEKDKDEVPDETAQLMLAAVSPAEDGSASEFSGQLDELKGADEFEAALTLIKIGDKEFPGVTFKYPEGNEHDHHH